MGNGRTPVRVNTRYIDEEIDHPLQKLWVVMVMYTARDACGKPGPKTDGARSWLAEYAPAVLDELQRIAQP